MGAREQEETHDWYDGEIFAMSGGTLRHAALGANASGASGELRNAFHGGLSRVLSADAKVVAHQAKHYVHPDVTVVCGPPKTLAGAKDVLENPSQPAAAVKPALSRRARYPARHHALARR